MRNGAKLKDPKLQTFEALTYSNKRCTEQGQ